MAIVAMLEQLQDNISLLNNTERGKQVLSDINKHDAAEKELLRDVFFVSGMFYRERHPKSSLNAARPIPSTHPRPHTTPDHPLMKAA